MKQRAQAGFPQNMLCLITGVDWGLTPATVLARLIAEIPWRQEHITLFGNRRLQPRLLCWMGDPGADYRYSGRLYEPVAWHPLVADLRAQAERLAETRFNSVLLNLYRDGRDSVGFHADDEPELGPRPIIASLSFGAERAMHFRHRTDRAKPTRRVLLPEGSLLIMKGSMQEEWKHAIPPTARPIGSRVNLTFRAITKPAG